MRMCDEEVQPEFCEQGIARLTSGLEELRIQPMPTPESTRPILQRCEEDSGDQWRSLIPGITDEVTTSQIFTRLTWTMSWSLSLVSRAWRRAFEGRQVFDARERAESVRETFVAVIHRHPICESKPYDNDLDPFDLFWGIGEDPEDMRTRGEEYGISLYDPVKEKWILLPDLPYGVDQRSLPFECGCVVLNGRLYILGGEDDDGTARAEMYMLDLATSRRVWQECASMSRPRSKFACHALDGKIYAFGGSSRPMSKFSKEAEVYDPEQNLWRPIANLLHHHIYHNVTSLGGELWVHGGVTFDEIRLNGHDVIRDYIPSFAELYNPQTCEWRTIAKFDPHLGLGFDYALVVMDEKLYRLEGGLTLCMYDVLSNSWIDELGVKSPFTEDLEDFDTYAAVAVGAEVIALVSPFNHHTRGDGNSSGITLMKSTGFGSDNSSITWEKIFCPFPFGADFQLLHAFQI